MKRKTLVILLLLVATPLFAQVPGGDFHAWFLAQVAGKSFAQQTLVDLQPALACVGSQLTPPNAVGERTKLWDPLVKQWMRVGFGEGHWVAVYQGPSEDPPPSAIPCGNAPAPPIVANPPAGTPAPVLVIDYAKIAELVKADGDATRKDLASHDDKQNQILAFFTNAKTIIGEVGIVVGYLIDHYAINKQ